MSGLAFYTVLEVAEKLHVSRRWLEGWLKGRDYGRIAGRRRIFSETELRQIYMELPRCSNYIRHVPDIRHIGASVELTLEDPSTVLQRLLTEKPRKQSSTPGKRSSNVVSLTCQKARGR